MLFDYAVTARVNGREVWQRITGSLNATAAAHTLAHSPDDLYEVENVRLLILPESRGDYDYLDQSTAEHIKLAVIQVDGNYFPTVYKVEEARRKAEREIRARLTRGQLPLPERLTA